RLAELLVSALEPGLPPSRRTIWLQSVLAAEAGLVVRLAERVRLYRQRSFPHDVQFFDLRLLFLLTALRADVRQQLFQELQGVHLLTEALELTLGMTPGERPPELLPPQETERAMEILKEDTALYRHLGTLLRHCVMVAAAGDRTEEFHGHTVNLLGNLPLKCLDVLLTLEPHEGSLEFLGVNMDVIGVLLSFLEKRLHQTHRLKESVAPALSVLTECARVHRPARKFLKAQLLRNKLVRLMTHLDTDVKRVAAEFLFVFINPVTGRVEEKPPDPTEGMTEEQKEHEAMKLVTMFDRLS
ncbi:hypothetical protein E2I00_004625, partial [Balaenoptera physalus]